ncbi:MAG: hypothetical protein JSW46_13290 [Gemmatimonadota bacterium]|nr:MAG: hypothetical protein JSW46_13290 [Gemmatimonadota bacterium]
MDLRTDRGDSTRPAPKSEHRLRIGQYASIDGISPIPDRDELDPGSDILQKRHPFLASIPLLGNYDYHFLGGSPPRQLADWHIAFAKIEDLYQPFRGEVFI